jgi:hypothetical protein
MKTINFSYNWNNKLQCRAFTTLRPSEYKVGDIYEVMLKYKPLGQAKVVAVKRIEVSKINDFIAYLDTGYSVKECAAIIERMYQRKIQFINLILFVYETAGN